MGLSLVSQPILAYISDRTSRKAAILPGAIILTVFTPGLAFATSELAVFALVVVIGLFLFSTSILLGAYGLDIAPPELHSSTTAAQFMAGNLLGSVAPLAAGVLATLLGIESVFFLAAGFFAVTLGLVLLLPSTKSRGHTPRFAAG
jgi:MFS family permease